MCCTISRPAQNLFLASETVHTAGPSPATIYAGGGIYEVDKSSGGSITRTTTYYPAAGAMRVDSTVYYVLKDQLGSASLVTDSSGIVVSENRYYPFRETRTISGSMYTDKLFTGQREMTGLGIYHHGARFYSPYITHFYQPDTIVPDPSNPQSWNRYSYVLNNPIRYNDPSGHSVDCALGEKYCQAGRLNVKQRAADLYNHLKSKDDTDDITTTWTGLTNEERSILSEGSSWTEGGFNDNGGAVVDPKNWIQPLGVELITRREVRYAKETQEFQCRVQNKDCT
jgi:RHS repeat-associated protein